MIDLAIHAPDLATFTDWAKAQNLIGPEGERKWVEVITEATEDTPAVTERHQSDFQWVRYGSGTIYSTAPTVDAEGTVTAPGTVIPGVFICARFPTGFPVKDYVRANAARHTVTAGLSGWRVDGITIIKPADLDAYLEARGLPTHTWLGGTQWSDPDFWVQDLYNTGDTVSHDGKSWVSLMDNNVWAPPIGWREVVSEGYPEWVQPSGSHDAYALGDRVSFQGTDYESTIASNVWSPAEYPAGWRAL